MNHKNCEGPALSHVEGFTIVELAVVILIIVILSGIILFSVTQYINKGKDANIAANLSILVPAGEVYYNEEQAKSGDGYTGFCTSSALVNIITQIPPLLTAPADHCYSATTTATTNPAGVCCYAGNDAWAACAQEYADPTTAYCVDSRGIKKPMPDSVCKDIITNEKDNCD